MATPSKIPLALADEIMALIADAKSAPYVHEWLLTEKKLDVSIYTVRRFIQRQRTERKRIANQIYADGIAKTAVSDIEILAENAAILRKLRDKAVEDENESIVIRACSELKSLVALKIGVTGAGSISDEDLDASKDELLDMILAQKEANKSNN